MIRGFLESIGSPALARRAGGGRAPRGFTLVELLVALAILAFVTGVVYEMYLVQYRNWISQDLRSEMLQRARVAINDMTRDVQMAGFRPQVDPVNTASATEFTFEFQNRKLPAQPVGFTKDRRITYRFDAGNNRIMKRIQSWNTANAGADKYTTNAEEVYLDNVTNLAFTYYDRTGVVMAAPVAAASRPHIRRIDVTVTAQTSDVDPITKNRRSITEASQIYPRNLGIEESTLDQTCPATPTGLASADPNACGQLDLTWTANTEADLAGYRIFYGTLAGEYSGTLTVGTVTAITLDSLSNNTRYYVAVGSFDDSSNSCALSAEVSGDGPSPDTNPTPGTPQQTVGLDATASGGSVNLTWTANATTYPASRPDSDANVTGYNVYRSMNGGSTWTKIGDAVAGSSYTDTPSQTLTCTVLWYKVEPVNCLGTAGPASAEVHGDGDGLPDGTNAADVPVNGVTMTAVENVAAPAVPTNFLSKSGYRRNYLVWDNPSDADFDYTIVRYSTVSYPSMPTDGIAVENAPGGGGRFNGSPNQTMTFTHDAGTAPPSLDINTTYYYTIFAYDKCDNVSTAQASAQTAAAQCGDEDSGPSSGEPPQPTLPNPSLTNTCSTGQATLNWNLINDQFPGGVFDLAGYNVYRSEGNVGGPYIQQNASLVFGNYPGIRTYTDTSLVEGETYYFKITATDCDWEVNGGANGGGESPASPIITVTPGSLQASSANQDVLSRGDHHEQVIFWVKNTKDNPPVVAQGQIRLTALALKYGNPSARVSRVAILNDLADTSDDEVLYSDTSAPVSLGSGSSIPLSGSTTLNGQEDVAIGVDFLDEDGTATDVLDMRDLDLEAAWDYVNVATDLDPCDAPMTFHVPLSPDAGPGLEVTVQSRPVAGTIASVTPGVNVANQNEDVNVIAHVHDDDVKGIANVHLFWATTLQTETTPPSTGWTEIVMIEIGGDNWSLRVPGDDRRIPHQNGLRIWYYVVATDNIVNFDRDPAFDQGAFTYDQLP